MMLFIRTPSSPRPPKVVSIENGDRRAAVIAARNRLVEEHMDIAENVARRIKRHVPASFGLDDLVSIGYIALMEAALAYPCRSARFSQASFVGYAAPWVRRAIFDAVRRKNYREHTMLPIPKRLEESNADPGCCVDQARKRMRVRDAIAALPERLRLVLQLHYGNELPFREIGPAVKVGKERASQLHMEAIRELRRQLAGENEAA